MKLSSINDKKKQLAELEAIIEQHEEYRFSLRDEEKEYMAINKAHELTDRRIKLLVEIIEMEKE